MSYDAKTERLISIKKLAGKAHTSNDKGLANEGLPSGLTITSETIFGETITGSPSSTSLYTITGQVEYIRFTATFIAGSDSGSGRHGFELKLPSNYESASSNPSAGSYPFLDDQVINITSGSLQLVPTSFSTSYEAKPYYGGSSTKDSGTQIPVLDASDWYMDYFNGIMFQQDPPGTGDHASNPDFVEAYLYIGDFLSTVVANVDTDTNTTYTAGNGLDLSGTEFSLDLKSSGGLKIDTTELAIEPADIAGTGLEDDGSDNLRLNVHGLAADGNAGALGDSIAISDASASNLTKKITLTQLQTLIDTDTNTTYTAGDGLDLNTTEFSLDLKAGSGLVIDTTELSINDSIIATITGSTFSGTVIAPALSGSLTHLSDGTSYLIAGSNITIVSGSSGAVTVSASASGDAFKTISVSGQDNVVADAVSDTLTLAGGANVTITTNAGSDTVTIASTDTNTQLTQEQVEDFAGNLVASGGTKTGITVTYQDGTGDMDLVVSDLTVAGDSGSTGMTPGDTLTVAGGTNVTTSMSGDTLTINASSSGDVFKTISVSGQDDVVADGVTDTLTLASGANITITTTAGSDTITIASADTNTQLTTEEVQDIVGGMVDDTETGISVTYDDTNGNLEFVVSDTTVAGDSGSTGITPGDTLTIAGGTNVTTAMSGDTLTIAATDTNTTYTAGAGLDLGGTTFALDLKSGSGLVIDSTELSIDNSVIATISGSTFSGIVTAPALSGSLTRLTDGSSYLIAGSNISIASGSSGAVTISSSASADQDVFKTISVSGQDNIVADATTDTLTLAAGSNVTITTNAGSDTITIASADTNTTYTSSDFDHDQLTNFAANEHIDWTADQGGTNIHAGNYTDTDTTYTAGDGLDLSGTTFSTDLKSAGGLKIISTELSVDDSIVATLTGSQFSGRVGIYGDLDADGNAVFNRAGADKDFRVVSPGAPAMLYVDGGNNRVGVGLLSVRSPDAALEVVGAGNASETMRLKHAGSVYGSVNPFLNLNYANASTFTVYTDGANHFVLKANHESIHLDTISSKNLLLQESGGKVGIGTTSPIAKLDVAGKIAISAESSTPAQPADGKGYLYSKTDGKLYWRSYDLGETDITTGAGETNTASNLGSGTGLFAQKSSTDLQFKSVKAGDNIEVTSDGTSITITSTTGASVSGLKKFVKILESTVSTDTAITFTDLALGSILNTSGSVDVFYNGQLLISGSQTIVNAGTADYYADSANSFKFGFDLEVDDVVTVKQIQVATNPALTTDFYVLSSDNESLTNARVLTAGDGISISTVTPRQITISSTGLVSRTKKFFDVTASHPATAPFDVPSVNFASSGYDFDKIDVFYNGQAMRSGSSYDYVIQGTDAIVFDFQLFIGDFVQVTTF